MNDDAIRETGQGVRIALKVLPRSAREGIAGIRDGRLVVRVTAPPVDGAANDAVVAMLAKRLNVPRKDVRVVSGQTSRQKTVEISGQRAGVVRALLLNAPD